MNEWKAQSDVGRKQSKQSKNRKILIDNKYEKMPFLHVANSGTAEQYLSDVKEKKRKKRKEKEKGRETDISQTIVGFIRSVQ